jgi:RNase P protein component
VAILITSKAIPLATQRNLTRRRVSAAVAHLVKARGIRPGVRIAISVRTAQLPGPADLREELLSLMKKSGILNS